MKKYKKYKNLYWVIITAVFIPFLFGTCSQKYVTSKDSADLTDDQREFISTVRYIIKKSEKKKFYSLATAAERDEFIENFWLKRDPSPGTEENEFKETYYDRIEEANHLFKSDQRKGWLSDRGRVYILLGPPELRRYRPGVISSGGGPGKSWYHYPNEQWFYGFYPIIFVDRFENGTFELTPLSSQHIATILRTANEWKPKVAKGGKIPYGFDAKVTQGENGRGMLQVTVPYKNILFLQAEGRFTAVVTLHVAVFDPETSKKIHDFSNDYTISVTEEELKTSDNYIIDAPFPFQLEPGKYELQAVLESKEDDLRSQRRLTFSI